MEIQSKWKYWQKIVTTHFPLQNENHHTKMAWFILLPSKKKITKHSFIIRYKESRLLAHG
ncbi:hypothetical protein A0256_22965 [Mucilaginibacter sp. PAMC 26640]|nr:hypothetical protein A0256_22965 [Mucilaginibacter sp. PAMC 26640]